MAALNGNQTANLRESLLDAVNQLTITDISSIKMITGAALSITDNTEQVSRNLAVLFFYFKINFKKTRNKYLMCQKNWFIQLFENTNNDDLI